MKTALQNHLKNIIQILFGNLIYTLGITMFIIPNNLITGGTTGLALVANRNLGISVSSFILISNTVMFLLGGLILGKKFAITTLISTFFYPIILEIVQHIPEIQNFTKDPLLATIFAGLMIGFGIGIVIKSGASTGGFDIPPLILNKKFGWSVSVCLYSIDFLILLLQMLFSSKEKTLYGILLVVIYSIVLDRVLLTGKAKTQVKIVSKKYDTINSMITHDLDRGSTLIQSETGYYGKDTKMILTVISNRDLAKLNQMVQTVDPHAFMIISQVNEVKGHGFTLDRIYH